MSSAVIGAFLFNLIVCFGIPLGVFAYLLLGKKKALKPFFIGMLAFFVSQILLRIPLMQYVLPKMDWYLLLQNQIWLYGIFLGFTAGLFEETARWAAMKFLLRKNQRRIDGIAFGFGHGGIEAMLLVGMTTINNVIYAVALKSGTFDKLMQPVPQSMAETLKSQMLAATPLQVSMGGVERIFTILFHVACSLLILKSVKEKKARYYWLALGFHTLLDAGSVILNGVFHANLYFVEVLLGVLSVGVLVLALMLFGKKDDSSRSEESNQPV